MVDAIGKLLEAARELMQAEDEYLGIKKTQNEKAGGKIEAQQKS